MAEKLHSQNMRLARKKRRLRDASTLLMRSGRALSMEQAMQKELPRRLTNFS